MKHLKTINELHSDTYKSAADKMMDYIPKGDKSHTDLMDMHRMRKREEDGYVNTNTMGSKTIAKKLMNEPDLPEVIKNWRLHLLILLNWLQIG